MFLSNSQNGNAELIYRGIYLVVFSKWGQLLRQIAPMRFFASLMSVSYLQLFGLTLYSVYVPLL